MQRTILITGAGGFIGSHFLEYFLSYTDWNVLAISSFADPSNECYSRLYEVLKDRFGISDRFEQFKHDFRSPVDAPLFNRLAGQFGKVDYVLNLASDSNVERSINYPRECFLDNCAIVANALEMARLLKPHCFIQMSTDEVYGEYYGAIKKEQMQEGHIEWSPIVPSNPYAASKAAQEALAIAYWRTYNFPAVIVNTQNNIGERQDSQRFLPQLIEKISTGKTVKIYAGSLDKSPTIGSRVYMDVKNHARAIHFILDHHAPKHYPEYSRPSRYNVCGEQEITNLELASMVAGILKKPLNYELVQADSIRPGYDKRYVLSPGSLRSYGWKPEFTMTQTLQRIIDFSLANPWWL